MLVKFWADGGMLGKTNPCPDGVFWSVYCQPEGQRGEIVIERQQSKAHTTNNEAEWLALGAALCYACKHYRTDELVIYSDSELIVNQFNKVYRINQERLRVLAVACWELAAHFSQCTLMWQPRREMVQRLGH